MKDGEFKLGEHEADIRRLAAGQEEMAKDIREIRDILSERKGERHVLAAIMGAVTGALTGHFTHGIR
jgi:hypothetical protein